MVNELIDFFCKCGLFICLLLQNGFDQKSGKMGLNRYSLKGYSRGLFL